jgi:hypothetical protein
MGRQITGSGTANDCHAGNDGRDSSQNLLLKAKGTVHDDDIWFVGTLCISDSHFRRLQPSLACTIRALGSTNSETQTCASTRVCNAEKS